MKKILFIGKLLLFISMNSLCQNVSLNNFIELRFYHEDTTCIKNLNIQIEQDSHIVYSNCIHSRVVTIPLPTSSATYNLKIYSEKINPQCISNIQTEKQYDIVLTNDPFFKDTIYRKGNDLITYITIYSDGYRRDNACFLSCMPFADFQPKDSFNIMYLNDIIWGGVPFFSWDFFTSKEENCNSGISSYIDCDYEMIINKPKWYGFKLCFSSGPQFHPASQRQKQDTTLSYKERLLKDHKDFTRFKNDKYFKVHTYIDRNKSWVCPIYKTEQELKYNQVIFMLTELHARLLRDFLSSYNAAYIYKCREDVIESSKRSYQYNLNKYKLAAKNGKDFEQIIHWYNMVNDYLKKYPEPLREQLQYFDYADQINDTMFPVDYNTLE